MRESILKPVTACVLCAVAGTLSMTALLHAVEGVSGTTSADTDAVAPAFAEVETADPPDIDAPAPEPATAASAADAIVRLAADEPRTAMDRALTLERHWLRLDTAERVAAVWAERAPNAALAFVQTTSELDPEAKSGIRARVLDAWAVVDAAGALGYLLSPEGQNLFFFDRATGQRLAREVSTQKPYELLTAADALPRGVVRAELRDAAIPGLVADDLSGAVREAALATPGSDQRQWVTAIVPEFVRADPDAALEWARDIDDRVPGTLRTVSALVQETRGEPAGPLNR
jgi:hypothetical protein